MILTMNRHAATALMLAACPLSASADQPQKQTPDQRPNIVVIVTDDHSYQTLGTCERILPCLIQTSANWRTKAWSLTGATAPTPCADLRGLVSTLAATPI